jgi:hypothetical protein
VVCCWRIVEQPVSRTVASKIRAQRAAGFMGAR